MINKNLMIKVEFLEDKIVNFTEALHQLGRKKKGDFWLKCDAQSFCPPNDKT